MDGQQQSELLPLFEQCTKEIADNHIDMYRNDLRYLRVWMQYANACRDPTEIFNYLKHRQIGLNYALYYEARAAFYELKGNHSKALDTYQDGISRHAQPHGRLQTKLTEFQHRMDQRIRRKMKRDMNEAHSQQVDVAHERQPLSGIRQLGGLRNANPLASSLPVTHTANKRNLLVYEDSPSGAKVDSEQKVLWKNLESQSISRGENQQRPSTWNTFRLPQQGTTMRGPALEILPDADHQGQDTIAASTSRSLRDFDVRGSQASEIATYKSSIAYNTKLPLNDNGQEQSLEEARPAAWTKKDGVSKPLPNQAPAVETDAKDDTITEEKETELANVDATINTREAFADIMSMFSDRLPCEVDGSVTKRKRKQEASLIATSVEGLSADVRSKQEHETADPHPLNAGMPTSLEIYEDTTVIENVMVKNGDSEIPGDPEEDVLFDDNQENVRPGPVRTRDLPSRELEAVDDSVILQPLSESRKAAMGVKLSEELVENGVDEDGNSIMVDPNEILRSAGDRRIVPRNEDGDEEPFNRWYDSMRTTMLTHEKESEVQVLDEGVNCIEERSENEVTEEEALIDPFDPDLCSIIMENQQPSLETMRHKEKAALQDARSIFGKVQRSGSAHTLLLGGEEIAIEHVLGKGAFAEVFRALVARTSNSGDREWAGLQEDDSVTCMEVALKVQSGNEIISSWELYIGRELCQRLSSFSLSEYLVFHEKHVLESDGEESLSLLIGRCANQGSLQQLLNAYLASGSSMDEIIVMYYTMDLLRIVGKIHSVGLQHGDIKPDNIMLRNDSDGWEEWTPGYQGTWKGKGISLCDWGRAIDMRALDGGPFRPDALPDSFRTFGTSADPDRAWSYAADSYGICGVVHCMLFGKYMNLEVAGVDAQGNKLYRPTEPMKRNQNVELWHTFFDLLLNPEPGEVLPPLQSLHDRFESYIDSDDGRRTSIKKQLMKQNIMMMNQ